jgi:uncharacterized membrane protein YbhN (UPF0104 family)
VSPATSPDPVAARPRRRLLLLARVGLAVGLLVYVLTRADWTTVAAYRFTMSWRWLALFVLLVVASHVISAVKWGLLLSARGHVVSLWRLTCLYTVGQFYNAVFPSTIGGDVVRALGLREVIGDSRSAFASMTAERFTGAAMLVALGVVAVVVAFPGLAATQDGVIDGRLATLAAIGAMSATTVAIVSVLSPRTLGLLRALLPSLGPIPSWFDKLEDFQRALHEYRRHPLVLAGALGYSLLFYADCIGIIYAACRMTGDPAMAVSLLDAAVMTPIILLIALLPLTPGGYGIVQWGYMVAFTARGISHPSGAATLGVFVSLMLTACNIGVSAAGYGIYTVIRTFEDGQGGRRGPAPDPT